jgi:ABC-type polysaccharide/polyol phosphate transport system ATPase subunit
VSSLSASSNPAPLTAQAPAPEPPRDLAVRVDDLHVTYRTSYEKAPTLRSTIVRLGRRQRLVREVHALRGVSLQVDHGTVLGIIGANGAGKSTFMRTVAGILPPDKGRVEVHGRVSTLLALGVGFNKELSGRENVILGGLAAGLTREEMKDRYEEIAAWAELEESMDQPMKTYSSGMYSRLAFSVAVHMEPDILLIDEALAAGDAHFKAKSVEKMRELCGQARTLFLVSHGMASIKELCNEVVWLDKGTLKMRGEPEEVIAAYTTFMKVKRNAATTNEDL